MPDVLPTDVENETLPFFVVGTSKHEEDLSVTIHYNNSLVIHSVIL